MSVYITETRVVMGYTPKELVSPFLFPELKVSGSPIEMRKFGDEMFKRWHTKRARLADSNVAGTGGVSYIPVTLLPRDLVKKIDKEHTPTRELDLAAKRLGPEAKRAVELDAEVDNRDRLYDVDNWPTGHKVVLSGTDQFTDFTNSDPENVFDTAIETIRKKTGEKPNFCLLPGDVFNVLKKHPKMKTIYTTGETEYATIERLQKKLGIERIEVPYCMVLDESDPANPIKVDIWSTHIVIAYVNPNPSPNREEMSFGYRYRENGYPKMDDESKEIDPKIHIGRRFADKFDDFVTCQEAGYLIRDTILK